MTGRAAQDLWLALNGWAFFGWALACIQEHHRKEKTTKDGFAEDHNQPRLIVAHTTGSRHASAQDQCKHCDEEHSTPRQGTFSDDGVLAMITNVVLYL